MRTILKGAEPASLAAHRRRPHADYEIYTDKDTLRQCLAREQRGLCCYCMSRIGPATEAMKIEHWHSRDEFPAEQLSYSNLLGACQGGIGQPRHLQHCDTRKGSSLLSKNPANAAHHIENAVRYEGDGRIRSENVEFND